jgi:hypothetical protein
MTPPYHVYCSCGRLLKIKVRREGVVLQCPEHGVIWHYQVGEAPRREKKIKRQDRAED